MAILRNLPPAGPGPRRFSRGPSDIPGVADRQTPTGSGDDWTGKPGRHDASDRLGARLMTAQRSDEDVALERAELQVGHGADGRGPRNVADQGDLAERVPRVQRPDALASDLDVRTALANDVEAVADLPLGDHDFPGVDPDVRQSQRETFELGMRQRSEDRQAAQHLERGVRNTGRRVDGDERSPQRNENDGQHEAAIARAHSAPNAATSRGASSEPIPMVATTSASNAPKTRPRTASGADRCRSVMPDTSTSVFPTPQSSRSGMTTAVSGTSATRMSGAPQSTSPAPNEVASLPREAMPAATKTARRAPTPTAPSRIPTPGSTEVEHLDRQHDDEHVEHPGDERLHGEEPDDDAEVRLGEDALPSLQQAVSGLGMSLARRLSRDPNASSEGGGDGHQSRRDGEHRRDARSGEEECAEGRPEEEADALDAARQHVRGGELLGRRDE